MHNKITDGGYVRRGGNQVIKLNTSNGTRTYLIVKYNEVDIEGNPVVRGR